MRIRYPKDADGFQNIQLTYPLRSKGIYIILALTLGMLGFHNFYARRTAIGFCQLLAPLAAFAFSIFLVLSISTPVTTPLEFATMFVGATPVALVLLWPIMIVWILIDLIIVTHDGNGYPLV